MLLWYLYPPNNIPQGRKPGAGQIGGFVEFEDEEEILQDDEEVFALLLSARTKRIIPIVKREKRFIDE